MKEVFLHIEDMPKCCRDCRFYSGLELCIITENESIKDPINRSPDCPLKCLEDPLQKPTTIKSVPGMTLYKAEIIFERDISACGYSYLTIYGKHINGYFCCIPNWRICCEMSEPGDTFYNFNKLAASGIDAMSAEIIAHEIKKTAAALSK